MPRAQLLTSREVMLYHLLSCVEKQKSISDLRVGGGGVQAICKHQLKHEHRPPPARVVLGTAPRAQLLSGRGRMSNIQTPLPEMSIAFFWQGCFTLPFHAARWQRRKRTSSIAAGSKGSVSDAWRLVSLLVTVPLGRVRHPRRVRHGCRLFLFLL